MPYRPLCTFWLALCALVLPSCDSGPAPAARTETESPRSDEPSLELLFTYGSEKEAWIEAVTKDFHAARPKLKSGKLIRVKTQPKGSGECIDELVNGTAKAHITSPASAAFIKIGNAQWRSKTGKDLIGSTENLVLSPVVIAMWKPMAEAIGFGKQPVGWADILALARDQQGWAARGFPQWGQFKFGHTHPQFSNSGLISLFAEVYAAVGKVNNLTTADVQRPETAKYLSDIERAVVHYGSSTGFFGRKMFSNGPEYLSAAVLYENMVIESYAQKEPLPFPIVAIYPKEGTFWSDHPAGVVEREWVTHEHREAAKQYMAYLMARPQQQRAMESGFRPGLADLAAGAPIDAAHGVNPNEPQTTLDVPSPEVIDSILQLWQQNKKRSNVTLVMDVSGSMKEGKRMPNAKLGAEELIKLLGDEDTFRLLPFNHQVIPSPRGEALKQGRTRSVRDVQMLIPNGGTALYDAIAAAYADHMAQAKENADKISAIVVLTDGDDTHSRTKLNDLLQMVKPDAERQSIRIFTIGYDSGGKTEILKKIADTTQAKSYEGKPENIREVLKDISTFF